MTTLEKNVKNLIIEGLELDIDPEEINKDTPLFDVEYGLGLDSLEALEIVTILSNEYGVNFDGVEREVFTSVATLSKYIEEQLKVEETS